MVIIETTFHSQSVFFYFVGHFLYNKNSLYYKKRKGDNLISLNKQKNVQTLDLNKSTQVNSVQLQKTVEIKEKKKKKKEMSKAEQYSYTWIDSPVYAKCTKNYFLYAELLLVLSIFTMLFQIVLAKANFLSLLFVMALVIIDFAFYIMFKNEMDVRQAKKAYRIYMVTIPFALVIMLNHFVLDALSGHTGAGRILAGIVTALVLICYLVFLTQEGFRDMLSNIKDIDVTEQIKMFKEAYCNIDEEDAILGHKIDMTEVDKKGRGYITDIPVVLPAKDRFLHMLVLGPTGCGKTSQTIIPMIWRDISICKLVNGKPVGITVLEPKGDLAEKVYAMVNYKNNLIKKARAEGNYTQDEFGVERTVVYFNPILSGCPYFNPLEGDESDVIENMCTTFNMLNADSPQFFKDQTDGLVRRGVKLLKRLYGDEATLLDLNTLLWNVNDRGRKEYVMALKRKATMPDGSPIPPDIQIENDELIDWFLNDYYAGIGGAKGAPKTYENTSGVRTQVTKLVSNKYLKKILNPPKNGEDGYIEYQQFQRQCLAEGHPYKINFDEALANGYIVTMSTAQGALRDLGRFLGYFIILQLQASVFRRPGTENTRTHNMLYIDEFQVYSNPGFADMLTQGRSYRVASHLATQARAQIGMGSGRDGRSFIELVSTNARNKIIYPGVSYDDAKYYSDEFGEFENIEIMKSYRKNQWWTTFFQNQETRQEKKEMKARFSPTDIIDRPFGQVTYRLIKKNNVSEPGVSQISYIPKEINDILDEMIRVDNENRLQGSAKQDYATSLNADDTALDGMANRNDNYEETLVYADPMQEFANQNQARNYQPQQPIIQEPPKQQFENAIYQQPQETQAPMSFGNNFEEYNLDELNISPERLKEVSGANATQSKQETVKATLVTDGKPKNPMFAGPQIVSRENRVPVSPVKQRGMDDLFGDVQQPSQQTQQAKRPAPPPPITPVPAHTKPKVEQPAVAQPMVGNIVRDDDI